MFYEWPPSPAPTNIEKHAFRKKTPNFMKRSVSRCSVRSRASRPTFYDVWCADPCKPTCPPQGFRGPLFGENARVKDSDMSTANVFEEKENADTSHCFSDLSKRARSQVAAPSKNSRAIWIGRKKGCQTSKTNRGSSPCSISSVWCGS